ncbi:DUF551 domain-containing protein [Enterobacter roggenkampii]|uniref:DUF551 domain-containing protein n=1 Tax=Enterobacter roggenkampii TaxID=1812935 RepID=UPI00388E95DA
MITLTKEWLLKTIAELEEERDATPGAVNEDAAMSLAAMKLALASLEAEPAIHRWRRVTVEPYGPYPWHYGNFIGFSKPVEGIEDEYFYSAPPAPVFVPDDVSGPLAHAYKELTPTFMRNHIGVFERYGIYPDGSAGIQAMRIALDGLNRRAAMLQGAENAKSPTTMKTAPVLDSSPKNAESTSGNSPVIPDGWVACSELMPEQFKAILAFNEYGEVWSGAYDRYWNFYCDNLLVEHVTHWMPLPAAPKQELK